MTDTSAVLELDGVSRTFGKVKAVQNVTLKIARGEVIGLTGENGAGKTTLLKILAGIERPDEGTMRINGKSANFRNPIDALKAGVGVVHQEQSLFTNLSVAENIEHQNRNRTGLARLGVKNWSRINRAAQEVLDKIGSTLDPRARVGDLSFVDRQMVEIARAVSVEPDRTGTPLIILDEPTAVLEQAEVEILEREIRKLKKFASVIFVSHRLDEVLRICDRVLVMRSGALTFDRVTAEVTKNQLFEAMVDSEPTAGDQRDRTPFDRSKTPAVAVTGLTRKGTFKDITFAVRPGEIVALVGTDGSGRGALVRTLFGAEVADGGALEIAGSPVKDWTIRKAVASGLAYVPAERKIEGMIGGYSGARNIALVHPREARKGPFLRPARMEKQAREWFERLAVSPNDIFQPIGNFSGGNQQKVVLAKWLNDPDLKVLILDHPLRGLDVGVSHSVNKEIRKACARGAAVVLIPDTIEEALEMADEILVLKDGEITARHDMRQTQALAIQDIVAEMV